MLIILYGKCFVKQLSASWNRNLCRAKAKEGPCTWEQHQYHSNSDVHKFWERTLSTSACAIYHKHWYFSDTKRTDMQALNDQKVEKGKVYLLFWDTFHYIISLAKGGNLQLQKEKQGEKRDSSRGQQSPCLSLADPRSEVHHYHNHSHLWMAEVKNLPVKTVFLSHVKKCKSEACYSLNTESTVGPIWGSYFWGTKMLLCGRLKFSSAVIPQQVLPSTSKDTLYEVGFWVDLFTPMSEINQ